MFQFAAIVLFIILFVISICYAIAQKDLLRRVQQARGHRSYQSEVIGKPKSFFSFAGTRVANSVKVMSSKQEDQETERARRRTLLFLWMFAVAGFVGMAGLVLVAVH